MPAFDGGDDFVGIGGPYEGIGLGIGLCDESVDGGLEVEDGAEDASLEAPPGELGEEAFDGVEPGRRGRREVEGEALVPGQPGANPRMGVGFVIVKNEVDIFSGGDLGFERIQEADELLMPVTLHAAANHLALKQVERGEESGRAVALVIVIVPARPFFMGRPGWVRSRAWIWLFSSNDSTSACSGGFRYRPTMSSSFSAKRGSLLSLKVSTRCGFRP